MHELGEIKKAEDIGRVGRGKWIWAACETCGKQRWATYSVRRGKPKYFLCAFCGQEKSGGMGKLKLSTWGEANPKWKGGRYKTGDGYICIKLSPDDFFFSMANHQGYVLEHRLVVAKRLGRCLQPWELVHHKNGIKDDNQDENLQLVSDQRHSQITILETRIKLLEKRITLLEAENALFKAQGIL